MKEAAWYTLLEKNAVRCGLCPHRCRIREGMRGICRVRENRNGRLIAASFARPVSVAVDPIEKKPLFHFYPGSPIFSAGPCGCTFKCDFCQNHDLSQTFIPAPEIEIPEFVRMIIESRTLGIAYTYSEPVTWFETIREVAPLVRERGMKNVMVTNGFIEAGPLRDLLPVIDAMNIDIKSMNPSFYRRLCKGSLAPVLRACEAVKAAGRHLEITHLLIPGENDAPSETEELARFIATHLGADTPLHLSRYFPRHRMKHPPTPAVLLERAWEIARKKLEFVYTGNIADDFREHTRCPRCDTLLITRSGYATRITSSLASGGPGETEKPRCGKCNHGISIVL